MGCPRPACACLGAVDLSLDERFVRLDRFPHESLDAFEVRGGERVSDVEVVVEAVVCRRADRQLGFGEEFEYRLGQHVGRRVPHAAKQVGLFFGSEIAKASLPTLA